MRGAGGEARGGTTGTDAAGGEMWGANRLYIPQAKICAGACALGPALAGPADWDAPWSIRLRITNADGAELFSGETSTDRMKRTPRELAEWAVRDNPIPPGSVLLTGTGLVPPDDYTLRPGHVVTIEIEGIGVLTNPVAG